MTNRTVLFLALGALVLTRESPAGEDLRDKLARCAGIAGDAARLRCYDEMAADARVATRGTAAAAGRLEGRAENSSVDSPGAPAEVPANLAKPKPLDDSVGKKVVAKEGQNRTYVGKLLRCEESGPSDKTYFYLEGGQVWRQAGGGRLRLKNCDSEAEISEDWIGFKLYIVSKNRTVRVSRIR